jgi:SAM-dependent methyltransferase
LELPLLFRPLRRGVYLPPAARHQCLLMYRFRINRTSPAAEGRELEQYAKATYDRFAPIYDDWNAENDYEMWLGEVLLPELENHGLRKGSALDVGCGTGRAFPPLLARGWRVIGCDVSPGMLTQARRKFGSQVRLLDADARSLPSFARLADMALDGGFDLILLLNDIVNYAIEIDELDALLIGLKRNLRADGGLLCFDANTLGLFREDYATGAVDRRSVERWTWRGMTDEIRSGGVFEARLSGGGVESHLHRERHWPPELMEPALEKAGLRAHAVLGQREESGRVLLADPPDEERDRKVIYIVGHAA